MNYVGIDLHRKFCQIHVYNDQTNKEHSYHISNDKTLIHGLFSTFKDNCKITVEATANWYWLVDLLQDMGREVLLANPLQTKAIAYARVQDDKVDARTLTHLLRTDLLPTCWIPNKEERSIRDMLRIRLSLLVMRTRFKNIIWAILTKFNINIAGSLWNENGRDSLETIITQSEHDDLARLVLPPPYGEAIRQALLHIDYLSEQIDYWKKKIHGLEGGTECETKRNQY